MAGLITMRSARWMALAVAVTGAAACGGASKAAGPGQSVTAACAPSGTVTLAVHESGVVDCSNGGNGFTLAGNGATYLVVPEFAVGNVGYTFQPFTLGRAGAPQAVAGPTTTSRSLAAVGGARAATMPRVNHRQATFDLRLLALTRKRFAALVQARGVPRRTRPPVAITPRSGPPDTMRSFHVIGDSLGRTFKTSVARLAYTGTFVYVYVDTAAPKTPNGFSAAQLQQFGQYADQVLYPLDLDTFGPPTDVDNNGHLIMLLTPIVNSLTPTSECNSEGFIAGFFDSLDLDDTGDADSNAGEIFYQLVPDSAGKFSCAHSVSEVNSITPSTFLHELQHMINNGQHVLVHSGQPEEGWLDEGESIVATELGARHYDVKYPPPLGRTSPDQLFPDSAEPFISEQLADSYDYLTDPDTASLTLHTDADCCLAWRAGDWLLLRYMGDQFDSTVFAKLDQSNLTGVTNIAHATGMPFAQMFANFGLALFTDSIPGVARGAIPQANRFASYNLRQLYNRLYTTCAQRSPPCGQFPNPFPIDVQALSSSTTLSGSVVPGTVAYYQVTTPSGSATVKIAFHPSGGGTFASGLHPQVAIFRLK